MNKSFVCLCEDVTVEELRKTIRSGYRDIEELKRITGIGTGPCQGKQCIQTLRRVIAEETATDIDSIPLTTLRPPIEPVPFGAFAARDEQLEG